MAGFSFNARAQGSVKLDPRTLQTSLRVLSGTKHPNPVVRKQAVASVAKAAAAAKAGNPGAQQAMQALDAARTLAQANAARARQAQVNSAARSAATRSLPAPSSATRPNQLPSRAIVPSSVARGPARPPVKALVQAARAGQPQALQAVANARALADNGDDRAAEVLEEVQAAHQEEMVKDETAVDVAPADEGEGKGEGWIRVAEGHYRRDRS